VQREKRPDEKEDLEIERIADFVSFPSQPSRFPLYFCAHAASSRSGISQLPFCVAICRARKDGELDRRKVWKSSRRRVFLQSIPLISTFLRCTPSSVVYLWSRSIKRPKRPDKERAEPEDVTRSGIHFSFPFTNIRSSSFSEGEIGGVSL